MSDRSPDIHDAMDCDVIEAIVAWNYPDHEHTRWSLRRLLEDLLNTAIRVEDEKHGEQG